MNEIAMALQRIGATRDGKVLIDYLRKQYLLRPLAGADPHDQVMRVARHDVALELVQRLEKSND